MAANSSSDDDDDDILKISTLVSPKIATYSLPTTTATLATTKTPNRQTTTQTTTTFKQKSKKLTINCKQEAVHNSLQKLQWLLTNVSEELSHNPKKTISEPLLYNKLLDFGDRLTALLPLILEAESIAHNVQEYQQRVRRNAMEKQVFYLAMKKYKKRKEYEDDKEGRIVAVFEDIDEFEVWKNKHGTQIKQIKFVQVANKSKEEADADADADDGYLSETECESPPSREKTNADVLIMTDADVDDLFQHTAAKTGRKDEMQESEKENEDDDEDSDIAMDGKKSAKQRDNNLSQSTHSRRKDKLAGQKRNRSQTDEDIDKSKPEQGRIARLLPFSTDECLSEDESDI